MIKLDGHTLTISDVWRIANDEKTCGLTTAARKQMKSSRALVDKLSAEPRAIYGINTGFGPLSGCRVSGDDLLKHQVNLLYHLSVGQGTLFDDRETRSIMVARANALARGYSGIREEVVDLLITAINRGILPEIPTEGSVGASGDLVPLAHMAHMLVGLGYVRYGGQRLTAVKALAKHKLKPVVLQSKEGLALVNGTSVMTGLAALAVHEAKVLLSWSELLSACLFQAMFAAPEVLCEQVHKARGFRGQSMVANRIADFLRSHPKYAKEIDQHQWGTHAKPVDPGIEIQDPYSVRCSPQVLGAIQESFWHIDYVVTRELNATTDNPLIFPDTKSVIHCGNFYGQQISMACDYLRIGLAKMALLLERQLDRLMNWKYSMGLPPLLSPSDQGLNSGLAGCQLLATSLAAECRLLSNPASVQTIPTNANNQDVVSMGCISAKMTGKLIKKLWTLTAIQSLALAQAGDLRPVGTMGTTYKQLRDTIRKTSPQLTEDRPLYEDIARVSELLQQANIQEKFLKPRPEHLSE